jgi:ankyrin repeat protein
MFDSKITKLLLAAKRNDLETVKACIENDKTDVNASLKTTSSEELGKVPARTTALMIAAKYASADVARYLVNTAKAMVTLRNAEGETAFSYALTGVSSGRVDRDQIATLLIKNGADTFIPKPQQEHRRHERSENIALILALNKGLADTSGLLIAAGVPLDVNLQITVTPLVKHYNTDRIATAMYMAIVGNLAQSVRQLLDQAEKTKQEICIVKGDWWIHGFNALDLAAQVASFEVFKLIYDHFKQQGHYVSAHRILTFLLLRGSTNSHNDYLGLPADYDFNIVKQFLDMLSPTELSKIVIEPKYDGEPRGYSQEREAEERRREEAKNKFRQTFAEDGQTLIFVAAKLGKPDCVEYLHKTRGLSLTNKDGNFRTPMLVAAAEGTLATVQKIAELDPSTVNIDYGTDKSRHSEYAVSPLIAALRNVRSSNQEEREEIVKYLLQPTANINARYTSKEITALTVASYNCSLSLMQQMLVKGASSDLICGNKQGENVSALSIACNGNFEVIPALISDLERNHPQRVAAHVNLACTFSIAWVDHKCTPLVAICAYSGYGGDNKDKLKVKAIKCPLTLELLIENSAKLNYDDLTVKHSITRKTEWQGNDAEKNTLHLSLITQAALYLQVECLEVLLSTDSLTAQQKKDLINQRIDKFGQQTILMILASSQDPKAIKIVQMLIAAGADLSLICNDGNTAFDYAKDNEMAKLLKPSQSLHDAAEANAAQKPRFGCGGISALGPRIRRSFKMS